MLKLMQFSLFFSFKVVVCPVNLERNKHVVAVYKRIAVRFQFYAPYKKALASPKNITSSISEFLVNLYSG